MREKLEKELEKIGLSEKEAKVYLGALELGPSTAQSIAAKATVNRPTTYIMIESLIKRGLMSSFEKGKKRYFISVQPSHLETILENDYLEIQKKKNILTSILPQLLSFSDVGIHQPKIRMFEDLAGLIDLQKDLINTATKIKSIDAIAAVDDARAYIPKISMEPLWKKINENKIKVRSLYTKTGESQDHEGDLWESRRLPKDIFPFHGELTIYGDRVSAISYQGKIFGILIESEVIAGTVRTIFELAWEASKKHSI